MYKEVLTQDSSCADAAQELIKVQIMQLMVSVCVCVCLCACVHLEQEQVKNVTIFGLRFLFIQFTVLYCLFVLFCYVV